MNGTKWNGERHFGDQNGTNLETFLDFYDIYMLLESAFQINWYVHIVLLQLDKYTAI